MNLKKVFGRGLLGCAVATASITGAGQGAKPAAGASPTRYFQLTVVLKYPGNELPEPRTESITTEVAVGPDGRMGSSKTRMTSQVPLVMQGTTRFMEIGTKFDCNNVRVDGDGLALSVVLETSLLNGTVTTRNGAGVETEEPLISQRNLELAIRLPLEVPKVVFDSQSMGPKAMPGKTGSARVTHRNERTPEPTLQIEMTARELK